MSFKKVFILISVFFIGPTSLYADAPIGMWSDATDNSITLGWTDSVDETAYNIYAIGSSTPLTTLAQNVTSYTVNNLDAATTYSFRITAIIGGVEVENQYSTPTIATTTHVWNEGPFRECINSWIGNSSTAIPTRNQLETLDSSRMIFCEGRNISDISPIADLKYIMALSLKNNLLTMENIAPLSSLTQLGTIIIADNPLSGEIPSWLEDFSNLTHLDLSNTALNGSIPSWIVNLSHMSRLFLYDNELTGTIPVNVGNWTDLHTIYLNNNNLTGDIPIQIGTLSNLTYLHLEDNKLTGSIPSEITNAPALYALYLSNNELTGTIPSAIGNLEQLTWLDLGHNQLSGTIPISIGTIYPNLIDLSDNKLTGEIPSVFSNNPNALRQLFLNDNFFSGEIPSSFTVITGIQNKGDLTMHNNCELVTMDLSLKTYLNQFTPTGYEGIVATNGNCFASEGDINTDEVIDLKDLIQTFQVLTNTQPSSAINKNADINGDKKIGLAEAIFILENLKEAE